MSRALLYLEWRSFAGGMRVGLGRLKRPRYLVTTLAGLAYFAFFLWRPLSDARGELDVPVDGFMRPVATLLITALLCLSWIFGRAGSLHFTPAEIDFLFPAPLSRRQLLRYRLFKFQRGFLVLSAVLALIAAFRDGSDGQPLYTFGGVVVTLNVLLLHGIAVAFLLSRVGGAVGVLCRIAPTVAVTASLALTYDRLPSIVPSDLPGWFDGLVSTGPAGIVLAPPRVLASLALARDPASFAAYLAPALLLAGLLYLIVERVDFPFEEPEIQAALRRQAQLEAVRRGRFRPVSRNAKPSRWPLAATGPPWRAIAWKNLVATSRNPLPAAVALFVVVPGVVFVVFGPSAAREVAWVFFLGLPGVLAAIAPLLSREDLRNDLELLDVLKSYPLSGRELLRGEVLGVSLAIGGLQAGLLFTALAISPTEKLITAPGLAAWTAALVVLPSITIASFTVANGLALLFPAWSRLELVTTGSAGAGVGNMGHALVMGFGQLMILGALLVAPSMVAMLVGILGYFAIGFAAIPIAATMGAAVLLGENELLLFWLGGKLERLDPSEEGVL